LTRGASADHQVIVRGSDWHLGAYDDAGRTAFRDSGFAVNTLSNGWHYLTAVGSNGNTDFYIDGVKVGTIPFKSNAQITYLGNYQGGGQQWGKTDELRISKATRSADWIATEFNNQNLPATFYTIYGENQTGLIVSPAAASLYRSQSQQFTTIPVADCNTAVTWRISPGDAGSIDSTGMYSAPATICSGIRLFFEAMAAGRLGRGHPPTPVHPHASLPIARGTEQAFRNPLQPRIRSTPLRDEVVHNQQSVFGVEGEQFERGV
jgi:hypothetical protein